MTEEPKFGEFGSANIKIYSVSSCGKSEAATFIVCDQEKSTPPVFVAPRTSFGHDDWMHFKYDAPAAEEGHIYRI